MNFGSPTRWCRRLGLECNVMEARFSSVQNDQAVWSFLNDYSHACFYSLDQGFNDNLVPSILRIWCIPSFWKGVTWICLFLLDSLPLYEEWEQKFTQKGCGWIDCFESVGMCWGPGCLWPSLDCCPFEIVRVSWKGGLNCNDWNRSQDKNKRHWNEARMVVLRCTKLDRTVFGWGKWHSLCS